MKDLYHPTIIRHSKSPSNFREDPPREKEVVTLEAYNPLCGDEFTLYLYMQGDLIEKVQFSGYGCAVSKAMTSLLTERLEGKRMLESKVFLSDLRRMLIDDGESPRTLLDEFVPFMEVRNHPERMTCVTLSIDALVDYFEPNKDRL